MNSFPGTGAFALTQLPINILGPDVLGVTATDRGSTPVAATSPQLANLVSETPSATYLVGDAGVGGSAFTRLKYEADLVDVYAIFAAALFQAVGFDDRTNPEWYHHLPEVAGLYKVGPQNQTSIASDITLDAVAALTNGDYATNAISSIVDGNVHIGAKVGGQDKTFNYPRVVDAICIVGTGIGQLTGWRLFTSQNGRSWVEATKSTLSGNGWQSGEKYYGLTQFRNVATSEARVILFNKPVVANYVKAVLLATPSTPWNLREVLALNRCCDVIASADLVNFTTDLSDENTVDQTVVRFSNPQVESTPGRTLLSGTATSSELVQLARTRAGTLTNDDLATLRNLVGKTDPLTATEFDTIARLIGRDPTASDLETLRLFGQAVSGGTPSTASTSTSAFSASASVGPITQSSVTAQTSTTTPVSDGVALPTLTLDEAKAIGRSSVNARIIQVDVNPWTARAGRDAEITISHLEVFNRADNVAFGTNGKKLVMRLAGGLPGEVADAGDGEILEILNNSQDLAKSIKAKIPLVYHTVTQTFGAGLTTTLTLADTSRRITNIKIVLNAAKTAQGALGDESFARNANGAALVTEVADTPDAGGEFRVNHAAGTITIFTATSGAESITYSYADEGSWATEISADGSSYVKAPTEVTLTGDTLAGGTKNLYVRGNQEIYTDNRERGAVLIASMLFAGNSSDIEAP